jgi:glycosyltransferase involved in cell wall biosynthesis
MTQRVLHVGKFFPPDRGGMETFLSDLLQTQRNQGIDSHALVHGQALADDPPWLRRVPVQLRLIYTPIALGFWAALRRAIRDIQPQVLHLHMPNVSAFWALTLISAHKIPWVVHWHSDVVVSEAHLALRLAYSVYRPFEQAVLERSERIIATSLPYLYASEPLHRWQHKCVVVPLGIQTDLPQFPAVELPWLPGRLKLFSLGRLAHYKGFDTLIRAVSTSAHLQLIIAGQGESMPSLQTLAKVSTLPGAVPNIQLLGEVSEDRKHQLLASCDAFCLASIERTEAFGVVLLEAMAHAKPCIVSNLPGSGMSWIVSSSGSGICHLPPGDATAWRIALEQLSTQPEMLRQWGAEGKRALHQRFSMTGCALSLASEYFISQNESRPGTDHSSILIVIPARDQGTTIGPLIAALITAGWQHVFVIDDHSSDDTGSIARRAGATVVRPILRPGAWGAMQLGARHAWAQGYRGVVTLSAGGLHEVQEITGLLAGAAKSDVVIGAHPEPAKRWFRFITGFELHEINSGFRYYNRKAIEILASSEATLLDYQDVGILLLLRKSGLRTVEVPVNSNTRQVSSSSTIYNWLHAAKYIVITTLYCLARWESGSRFPTSNNSPERP